MGRSERPRRLFSRLCLMAAVALGIGAAAVPPSSAKTAAELPPSFLGGAFATPVQIALNTQPFALPELIRMDVAHGTTTYQPGNPYARAASLYPGVSGVRGLYLGWSQVWSGICNGGFPCDKFGFPPAYPFPPYPFSVEAPTPEGKADARQTELAQTVSSGPVTFTVNDVRAHADEMGVSTTAVISNFDFLNPSGSSAAPLGASGQKADTALVHVTKLTATTQQSFDDRNVLVVTAAAKLSDVSLFAGTVRIASIETSSRSRADGRGLLDNAPKVTIQGVTVNGVPAELSSQGLMVNGQPIDQGNVHALGTGVKKLFGADGASVRLVDATQDSRSGRAQADAVGVLVHFVVDGTGLPNGTALIGDLVLGQAQTGSYVNLSGGGSTTTVDTGFQFPTVEGTTTRNTFAALAPQASSGEAGFTQAAFSPQAGTATPGPRPTGTGRRTVAGRNGGLQEFPLELLSGVAADRMRLLYGAWTLAALGLALGSRSRWFRPWARR